MEKINTSMKDIYILHMNFLFWRLFLMIFVDLGLDLNRFIKQPYLNLILIEFKRTF